MTSDPLRGGPPAERALFEQITKLSDGKPLEAVLGAAINMIVNALRQTHGLRKDAEAQFDVLFGKAKTILLNEHYDSVTGKRRGVMPFTQVLHMPYHIDDDA